MTTSKRTKTEAPVSAWADLPDEIVTEVLLRLPVTAVLRCRAVCRAWAATLSSDEFRATHEARAEAGAAAAQPSRLLVVAPTSASCHATAVYSYPCTCSPPPPEPEPAGASLLLTLDGLTGDFVDGIAAPCRGLVLLYDAVAPAYYVVNAATRAATRLPPGRDDVVHYSAGLGYDPRTSRHKVMRLLGTRQDITCEVYTLGGDRWVRAAGTVPPSLSGAAQCAVYAAEDGNLPPVFANGSLHWLICGMQDSSPPVDPAVAAITFSVTEETFGWLQAPPCGTSSGVQLVELDGCLGMVRDLRRGSPDCNGAAVEIWKLHDYASGVWSLDTRIDLSHAGENLLAPEVIRVLGATGGDGRSSAVKKIVMATSNHTVHAYDTVSKNVETILSVKDDTPIRYPSDRTAIRVCLLKETYAPVHRAQEEISLSSPVAKATKEFLLRLPPRSIVQSKLVCSQWRRLIEDNGFIHSYSARKSLESSAKIMIVGKGTGGRKPFRFTPLENWFSDAADKDAWLDSKVVCSKPCHGLNLLITTDTHYLYNPCTGYWMSHPCPGSLARPPWETPADGGIVSQMNNGFATGNRNVGLGFNPYNQEHVSVIMLYAHKDFKSRRYHLTCSMWLCRPSFFQYGLVPSLPVNDMPPAYVDGMLFWMSDPRLGPISEYAILCFDIATTTFEVAFCPPEINTAKWSIHSTWNLFVAELRGKLCVVLADLRTDELVIWEWENGEWDEIYTVRLGASPGYSLRSNVVVPLAVDPMDGRILLSTGRKMGFYDPVSETVGELYDADESLRAYKMTGAYSQGAPCQEQAMPVVPMLYEESIVSYPSIEKDKILH